MTGYIYCFSNELFPSYLKIGVCKKTPKEELDDLNLSIVSNVIPCEYKHMYSIYVHKPKSILKYLNDHITVSPYHLYETTMDRVKSLLLDYIVLHPKCLAVEPIEKKEECIKNRLEHNQKIRHIIDESVWKGRFDKVANEVVCYDKDGFRSRTTYKTLERFAKQHYKECGLDGDYRKNVIGWNVCEMKKDGKWIEITE